MFLLLCGHTLLRILCFASRRIAGLASQRPVPLHLTCPGLHVFLGYFWGASSLLPRPSIEVRVVGTVRTTTVAPLLDAEKLNLRFVSVRCFSLQLRPSLRGEGPPAGLRGGLGSIGRRGLKVADNTSSHYSSRACECVDILSSLR